MPIKKETVKTSKEKVTTPKTVAHKVAAAEKKPIVNTGSTKVYDLEGQSAGIITLPKEVFGQTVKKSLLAQAVRVYESNSKKHTAHTKTRGEVRGGGAKPWRQKGTGRARAGSRRSPLWVGGGITFGPRNRDSKLELPGKMKKKALIYALSEKSKNVTVAQNLEKVEPKTKVIVNFLKKIENRGPVLFVTSTKNQNLKLATRNIPKVDADIVTNLNAYQVLKVANIIMSKEAIEKLK